MAGYTEFAYFYDGLTANVDYKARAAYFDARIRQFGTPGGILLDLACGTGSLGLQMERLGYDLIGVDASADMLSVAMDKKVAMGSDAVFLCQTMQALDLYGTVDNVVCALDSLNHITDTAQLQKALARISLFLVPGGLFVFDVNTVYKHRQVLSGNTFVYEDEGVFCVWQNSVCDEQNIVEICLDVFEQASDGAYLRHSEAFCERAYSFEQLREMLGQTGLSVVAVFDEDSVAPVREDSQRMVIVAKKDIIKKEF